jgi:uncharacterized protein
VDGIGGEHVTALAAARRAHPAMARAQVAGLVFGAIFGAALAGGRLDEYDVIHGALRLRNLYMLLVMGTAVAVALPGLWLLERAHALTLLCGPLRIRRERIQRNHILGGIVFGAGWALSGSCPGPVLAMTVGGTVLGGVVMLGLWAGTALRDRVAPAGA